jgi:membrane protease YdiL (CAAX protease family)
VLPLIWWIMLVSLKGYQWLDWQHEPKHELLKILVEASDWRIKAMMVVSAVLLAPLFEEMLFRGHLQTLLLLVLSKSVMRPSPAARWGAVCFTSLLFTAIHPWWSWPGIFFLSLCLGYAYERTGNLMAPILIHAMFNGFNTLTSYLWPH